LIKSNKIFKTGSPYLTVLVGSTCHTPILSSSFLHPLSGPEEELVVGAARGRRRGYRRSSVARPTTLHHTLSSSFVENRGRKQPEHPGGSSLRGGGPARASGGAPPPHRARPQQAEASRATAVLGSSAAHACSVPRTAGLQRTAEVGHHARRTPASRTGAFCVAPWWTRCAREGIASAHCSRNITSAEGWIRSPNSER
jgi:hypothetical protein